MEVKEIETTQEPVEIQEIKEIDSSLLGKIGGGSGIPLL